MRCAGPLLQAFEAKGLFGHMTETQRAQVYELMTPRTITPGTELMKQGDNGDTYFVIESGTADVYVHGPGEVGEQFSQSLLSRADRPLTNQMSVLQSGPGNVVAQRGPGESVGTLFSCVCRLWMSF